MIAKRLISRAISFVACLAVLGSCSDYDTPGTYYTFTGDTVASFLERKGDFTQFIEVMKKCGIWGEMKTYGTYTCFAPTDRAFEAYLAEKGVASVQELTVEQCDTIAWSHLLSRAYFTTDLDEGAFPTPNMLDRFLTYSCDSDSITGRLYYLVNKSSRLLETNDTVENGVVQIIDRVVEPSSQMLPDMMALDTAISIFYEAMVLTHLHDSLTKYYDIDYKTPSYDSITTGVKYATGLETEYAIYPAKRYFKYTAFVERNDVFRKKYKIYDLNGLIAKAKELYDESYPEDAGLYDDDFTNRKNPLNRFISYHLMEFYGQYGTWNVTNDDNNNSILDNFVARDYIDLEDFFETMMPHAVMRISTPQDGSIYINRRGTTRNRPVDARTGEPMAVVRGAKIYKPSDFPTVDQNALNGVYHYIDDIIAFDDRTRNVTLNVRMRFDCTTLSPDFVNSGGRNRPGTDQCTGMLSDYTKWWSFSDETLCSVRNRHSSFQSYEGDEVIISGQFDAVVKLPPVPVSGTYELRFGYCAMDDRGVVQCYFNNEPCNIPVDLRIRGNSPKIGWLSDSGNELNDDPLLIQENEKAMHNRGYKKGPASYGGGGGSSGNIFRNSQDMLRYIVTTQYMSHETDNYLRVRQVLTDIQWAGMIFDYIELVPKSVFGGLVPEDKY